MNYQLIAKVVCALLSVYFVASGMDAVLDIDTKLQRIGLAATSPDGKIAFILIYCGLMVGIGLAMAVMAMVLRSPGPSLMLAGTTLLCFILFRLVGSAMAGELTRTQASYILTEAVELSVVVFLLFKTGGLQQRVS